MRVAPATDLTALAAALNDLYRLSGSARFHAARVSATGVPVSRTGLRVLSHLADGGAASVTRLAEGLDVSQATASRVVAQLEAAGLVRRRPSATDGRVSHWSVTPAGRRALQRIERYHVEQLAMALADVDGSRRAVLTGAVQELVLRLHQAGSDAVLRTA